MIRPMKGRILWETAFFGLLSAVGLAALLVAMVLGALVAAGVSDFGETAATFLDHLTAGGGAIAVAILALSYLTGGYVAARMARFDGWRQGLGVWLLSVLVVAAGAITAWIAGGTLDPTESISLPSNPIDTGPLQSGWLLTAVGIGLSLLASVAGGVLGESYHRSLDREEAEGPGEPEPGEETEPDERTEEKGKPEAESEAEEPTEAVPA
jgi:MFS family permease